MFSLAPGTCKELIVSCHIHRVDFEYYNDLMEIIQGILAAEVPMAYAGNSSAVDMLAGGCSCLGWVWSGIGWMMNSYNYNTTINNI